MASGKEALRWGRRAGSRKPGRLLLPPSHRAPGLWERNMFGPGVQAAVSPLGGPVPKAEVWEPQLGKTTAEGQWRRVSVKYRAPPRLGGIEALEPRRETAQESRSVSLGAAKGRTLRLGEATPTVLPDPGAEGAPQPAQSARPRARRP